MSRRIGCVGCVTRFILAAILLGILAGVGLYYALFRPYPGFKQSAFIEIPKGTTTRAIADQLAKSGVIRSPWQFLLARAFRSSEHLQAGEYRFARPASVWTVYDRITHGDVYYYDLKVPEGSNMF